MLELAQTNRLSYPLPEGMSDKQLAEILFPVSTAKPEYKMPDYEYVSREMQKSGVTLNLLWLEYCKQCSNNGETLHQLTQFKKSFVEGTVRVISSFILAALRNCRFLSLTELNEAISERRIK